MGQLVLRTLLTQHAHLEMLITHPHLGGKTREIQGKCRVMGADIAQRDGDLFPGRILKDRWMVLVMGGHSLDNPLRRAKAGQAYTIPARRH